VLSPRQKRKHLSVRRNEVTAMRPNGGSPRQQVTHPTALHSEGTMRHLDIPRQARKATSRREQHRRPQKPPLAAQRNGVTAMTQDARSPALTQKRRRGRSCGATTMSLNVRSQVQRVRSLGGRRSVLTKSCPSGCTLAPIGRTQIRAAPNPILK
jgi:hypothetical protein